MDLRLADLLAAISIATDLGMGQEPEKAIRSCLVATGIARGMDLPDDEVRDVYLTTLLRHLGCTATAHEETYLFGGDEHAFRPRAERTDFGNAREALGLMLATGRGTGAQRPRHLARALRAGKEGDRVVRALCEVASHLARRLALGPGVETALAHVMERWDGKGGPARLRGEDIALPARVAEVATQAVIFHREGGVDAARAIVAKRAGGWFDPGIAERFVRDADDLLGRLDESDAWTAVLDAEPQPVRTVGPVALDGVLETFADMVDLKSPWTLGHSTGVARLAADAARALGLPDADIADIRRAALVHDLGRTGVSNAIWDKPRTLTTAEWEAVRLHAYHTERILARSAALAPLARAAGMHHERRDGSGYHRGASGAEIPHAARIIAAADALQAMTQDRPHRPGRPEAEAADLLASDPAFDPEFARAVIAAAGGDAAPRASRPAGLTDREIEVLRLVARGLSNREIARALFVSPRTAEHHVQNIYAKIGTSTRAGAALFAMEHDLLRR